VAHDRTGSERTFSVTRCDYRQTTRLARELDLAEPVAAVLVRRGFDAPEAAREFLAADESHPPEAFAGIDAVVAQIRAAIDAKRRITVHGDYDVDGTTATAIVVRALRELGAECDWLIPGRVEDGYGLTETTVERLAERGTSLVVTVDCGITSVAEVAAFQARGIEVIVTDHHQPGPELPDCPIVHPVVSSYPCPDLCAAGVAHKLVAALASVERAERDLDLVALATVADMVSLTGENRSLVRRGLDLLRRRPRSGLRALMAAASVTPERLDASDLSFRLAPRINAAGRLYRADAAVELFLSEDDERSRAIATELDRANLDRRETEAEVLAEASRTLAELSAAEREAPAIVLWGEGWHPGVVGICASRLAERHLKPTVLIALDEQGRGKGSGRSVPGFDLLAGLASCSSHLARFGGHRAAAGLEIERDRLEEFRCAFADHARAVIDSEELARVDEIDAVVGGESLGHEVAAQLARLGPFGKGNPEVRLLVPGARIEAVRPLGDGERHARFALASGGARASGVAFGVGSSLARIEGTPASVSVRLELNEWNGAVEPRVVLGSVYEPPSDEPDPGRWRASDERYGARYEAELGRGFTWLAPDAPADAARQAVEANGASAVARIAALVATGEPVLVVCADALWRRALVESAVRPEQFCGGNPAIVAGRGCVDDGADAALAIATGGKGGLALADWAGLALRPGLARDFEHVVIADPAPHPAFEALLLAGPAGSYLHDLAGGEVDDLARRALRAMLPGREDLGAAFRSLRDAADGDGVVATAGLRMALCGDEGSLRSPEACARIVRVLSEIGVVRTSGSGAGDRIEVVSSARGDLSSSMSFRALENAHEECTRFLSERKRQSSTPRQRAA
jgi:single-stranded-DNA-specific exonuclease